MCKGGLDQNLLSSKILENPPLSSEAGPPPHSGENF